MSLFGGENSAPQSPSHQDEPLDSPPIIPPAISSWSDVQSHNDSEIAQPISYTLEADDEEEEDDLDESESELDPDGEASRPNRFAGKRTTWKGYTAADRQIAASLDQIQSGDLAAHLFNAHALKRRVRLPADQLTGFKDWQGKDLWLKKGTALQYTDISGDTQSELVPLKRWTAWPLPAGVLPAPDEKFGRRRSEEEDEGWAIRGFSEEDAGDELREEIQAVMLRLAKEKYKSRQADPQSRAENERKGRSGSKSRSRSSSKTAQSIRSSSPEPYSERAGPDIEMEEGNGNDVKIDDDSASQSSPERKWEHLSGKRRNKKPETLSTTPIILADDDKARRILQPTINSLLSQLDGVAAAIRRTRLNHFGRGVHSDTSGSEGISDAGSTSAGSRSQSRSRSKSTVGTKSNIRHSSRLASVSKSHLPPKSSNLSRKKPVHNPVDSDSASDYGAEFEPEEERQSENSKDSPPKRNRSGWKSDGGSDSSFMNREASVQVGLLDWSEVLGVASMTGWDERAIARTAQRCATLFGEGMAFRSFDEGLAMKPAPEPVHYNATTIPGPDILGVQDLPFEKHPLFQKGMLNCPHTDCSGHNKKFEFSYRVIEHIKRTHGYDPRLNDSDNEEGRKYGGVHTDGFLLPIHAQQGWLGGGRAKSASEKPQPRKNKEKSEKKESGSSSPILLSSSPV